MKSLHVGNLANVAYGCCKILKQAGHDLNLIVHDERHLMSQPEWDDLELKSEDFLDEFDFAVNRADFGDYKRPDWFHVGTLLPQLDPIDAIARRIAPLFPARLRRRCRPTYHRTVAARRQLLRKSRAAIPRPLKELGRKPYALAVDLAYSLMRGQIPARFRLSRAMAGGTSESADSVIPRGLDPETRKALEVYRLHSQWYKRHTAGQDVSVAYVLAPIYAYLAGDLPYVSVEIGTMRDIPFDGTDAGRALALAYQHSDFVLITNPDVISSARRLGLERYAFCPHPVDEDVYSPQPNGGPWRHELLAQYQADHLLFAPARQNWEVKGNDRYFQAFARLLQEFPRTTLIIPGWGQEVERSKRLCKHLGIESRVAWVKPVSERGLVKYYQAVDVVLDQFALSTFGLVTGKALATGCSVVTSYDPNIHTWCFEEHPPLISAQSSEQIAAAVGGLLRDQGYRWRIGAASRVWALKYHSKKVVQQVMERAMGEAIEHFRRKGCSRRAA
jgi:glycosyltransferase involved in cell wall biosynthesis